MPYALVSSGVSLIFQMYARVKNEHEFTMQSILLRLYIYVSFGAYAYVEDLREELSNGAIGPCQAIIIIVVAHLSYDNCRFCKIFKYVLIKLWMV